VLLLYALAKLAQTRRGWETLVQHEDLQNLISVLLDQMADMTSQLDAQVRLQACSRAIKGGPTSCELWPSNEPASTCGRQC
jgi:hypothetical protein